jgi:hypothetical protein
VAGFPHHGAVRLARVEHAFPAEFGRALAHGTQSNPGPEAGWQARARVGDLKLQAAVDAQADLDGGARGVPGGVGHGLDRDAVGGHLHRCGQRRQRRRDGHAGAAEPGRVLADRADQAYLVQHGGT